MPPVNNNPIETGNIEPPGQLVSNAIRVPGLKLETFLAHSRGKARFLWQTSTRTLAGTGIVSELSAWGTDRFQQLQDQATGLFQSYQSSQMDSIADPCLFGGFSFQDDFIPDNTWSIYAPAIFVLPHYQFAQLGDDDPWLILNVTIGAGEDTRLIQAELHQALLSQQQVMLDLANTSDEGVSPELPIATDINFPMPYEAWHAAIERATQVIKTGELMKVVLARAFEIRFAERVNVEAALRFLTENYANCYRFLFEPRPYHAFYGATPEQLIQVRGTQFTTMALAGSIRRGQSTSEDQALAENLLADSKERSEHDIVVKTIREKLAGVAYRMAVPDTPQILQLSNIQHLFTPISGQLREPTGILPLAKLLHPTPALGGKPSDVALQFISAVEPVPRGWYAAPIGIINPQLDGEFGVAIRSAVSEERRVWLYAGAGIVADSQPQKEWDETMLKFRPMLNALGLTDLKGLA